MRATIVLALAAVALAGCSTTEAATPPAPAGPYTAVITEPSQNILRGAESHLVAYWSCAPDADPRTRLVNGYHSVPVGAMSPAEYQAEHAKWTQIEGEKGLNSLRVEVPCKPGDTITVGLDAAARAYRPTQLRCEIFAPDGTPVAREEATRPAPEPVCRTVAR